MNSIASGAASSGRWKNLISTIAFAVAVGYAVALALMLLQHHWVLDANGKPALTDFVEVWVAGRSALAGAAAATYDIQAHHAAQVAGVGHSFRGYLLWNYPPLFLIVAMFLACLPYAVAFVGWVAATVVAYALAIGVIAKRPDAAFVACAAPFALANAVVGQTGFLTAALMGGTLVCVDRRPILAGVFLGLLTYKPQFGILFPIILAVAGYWRVLASALLTTLLAWGVAWLSLGTAVYGAFFRSLPIASHFLLTDQGEDWRKMQSVYTIARLCGAGDTLAWISQGLMIALCLGTMIWLWRQSISTALKAAGLPLAAMLATPYLHMYDFPVLAVALAFLYRDRAFDRVEWIATFAAFLMFLAYVIREATIGPVIELLVMGLVLRRSLSNAATVPNLALRPA